MRKPKKMKRRKQSNQVEKRMAEPEPEIEEIALEDDPNYKIDKNSCECWYDEVSGGIAHEMDDWAEFDG